MSEAFRARRLARMEHPELAEHMPPPVDHRAARDVARRWHQSVTRYRLHIVVGLNVLMDEAVKFGVPDRLGHLSRRSMTFPAVPVRPYHKIVLKTGLTRREQDREMARIVRTLSRRAAADRIVNRWRRMLALEEARREVATTPEQAAALQAVIDAIHEAIAGTERWWEAHLKATGFRQRERRKPHGSAIASD